jgi:PAS domain S-box-containing protein
VQTQEGQWYTMRIQPYRTLENVIEGAVLTFVEITEQKELHMALCENEEKLSALFQILPVGVSVLDAKGKIVYVNPALEKMLELAPAGLLGSDATQQKCLRPDRTPMPPEEFAGARAEQARRAVHHIETGLVKENGRVVWTDMSAVPLTLPGWKMVIVTFDLTSRQCAEATQPKPGDAQ